MDQLSSQTADISTLLDGRYRALNLAFQDIKSKYLKQKENACSSAMTRSSVPCDCPVLQHRLAGLQRLLLDKTNQHLSMEKAWLDANYHRERLEKENTHLKQSYAALECETIKLRDCMLKTSKENIPFETTEVRCLKEAMVLKSLPLEQNLGDNLSITTWNCCNCRVDDRLMDASSPMTALSNVQKQIKSLTMEKKQLMTNVHWLSTELLGKEKDIERLNSAVSQCCCSGTSKSDRGGYVCPRSSSSSSEASMAGSLEEGRSVSLTETNKPTVLLQRKCMAEKLQLVTDQMKILKRHLMEGNSNSYRLQQQLETSSSESKPKRVLNIHEKDCITLPMNSKVKLDSLNAIYKKLELTPSSFSEFKDNNRLLKTFVTPT